jgi:hypothetical protein
MVVSVAAGFQVGHSDEDIRLFKITNNLVSLKSVRKFSEVSDLCHQSCFSVTVQHNPLNDFRHILHYTPLNSW